MLAASSKPPMSEEDEDEGDVDEASVGAFVSMRPPLLVVAQPLAGTALLPEAAPEEDADAVKSEAKGDTNFGEACVCGCCCGFSDFAGAAAGALGVVMDDGSVLPLPHTLPPVVAAAEGAGIFVVGAFDAAAAGAVVATAAVTVAVVVAATIPDSGSEGRRARCAASSTEAPEIGTRASVALAPTSILASSP